MTIPTGSSKYGNECAVCLVDFKKNNLCLAIGCGHVYHKKCFDDFYKINRVTKKCFKCQHPVFYESSLLRDKLCPAVIFSLRSFSALLCLAMAFRLGNKYIYWKNHYQNEDPNTSPAPWRRKTYVPDHLVILAFVVTFFAVTLFKVGKSLIDHQKEMNGHSRVIRYAKN